MQEYLQKILSFINSEYADIRYETIKNTEVTFIGNELEKAGTTVKKGGGIRVFHKGSIGFSTFTRIEDGEKAARHAEHLARVSSPTQSSHLAEAKRITGEFLPQINRDPRKIPLEEKVELTRKYNDIILKEKQFITSSSVSYKEQEITHYFISNSGSFVKEVRVHTGISIRAVSSDGANIQTAHKTFGDQRGYNTVTDREADVEATVKDAIELLKAEKVTGGLYTVVMNPELAGVFIHEAFGHLSESDHIYRNEKLKKMMKKGKKFGIPELSVVDDGTLKGERGYIAVDDDGVPSQRTYLIKDGELVGRLHSRHTAYLMGEQPTGNARALDFSFSPIVRMTNTFILPGKASFEEIIGSIKNGIYAVNALGGQTELEMFTFSSLKGYEIKNGKIGKMLRDIILTGNVFETLHNIESIGNDLKLFGGTGGCGKAGQFPLPVSDGAPHIKIKNLVVGGK